MLPQDDPAREVAAVKAALIRFAASLDLHELPDEPLRRLYETDAEFRAWYHEAPELQPMHEALRQSFESMSRCPPLAPPQDPSSDRAA